MNVRSARYLLTRLLFMAMGLRVSYHRKEVEGLWRLSNNARSMKLDQILARNRPLNVAGEAVTGLGALMSSPFLSKKQFLAQAGNRSDSGDRSRFGRHTAGTTGEPTRISLDKEELSRMLGVRDYCFRHYGIKLGQREARLWGRPGSGIRSRVKNFVMNRRIFHPVGPDARREVEDLLAWRPDYLYGYGSLLLEAARILDTLLATTDLEFQPPTCVICTAESILPAQKAFISRVFRAPVAEEYGSTEFDILAFECTDGHRHLVNPWVIVENPEDNRCFVTDVSRTSQNLVRYESGDFVSLKSSSCAALGATEVIDQLEGRSINRFAYVSKNEKFHALEFARAVNRYQSMSGKVFGFTVYQHQYGCFVLEAAAGQEGDQRGLSDFISDYLYRVVGVHVDIKPTDKHTRKEPAAKKGYFVQTMELDHDR